MSVFGIITYKYIQDTGITWIIILVLRILYSLYLLFQDVISFYEE
jgi:hypothetical protein